MSPTFVIEELGMVSADRAISIFKGRDWAARLLDADARERAGSESATPDLTLTVLPSHMIIEALTEATFKVEICIPRETRLFGFIPRVKFYTFREVTPSVVEALIAAFCGDSLALKHSTLSALAAQVR
jgi:hypothetical protein